MTEKKVNSIKVKISITQLLLRSKTFHRKIEGFVVFQKKFLYRVQVINLYPNTCKKAQSTSLRHQLMTFRHTKRFTNREKGQLRLYCF